MTPFTKRVYKVVLSIPLGEVRSYKWVAQKVGNPRACRAVGQVLNKNPYTIIIPCHRVVNSDGTLGGYAKGVDKKRRLLSLERKIKLCLQSKK